jgi:hypothetical protein
LAPRYATRLQQLVPEAQSVLVAFLETDLSLSSTLLETAEISTSRKHAEGALERVRRALGVIRRLSASIDDPVAQANIQSRAARLEIRLETFAV